MPPEGPNVKKRTRESFHIRTFASAEVAISANFIDHSNLPASRAEAEVLGLVSEDLRLTSCSRQQSFS